MTNRLANLYDRFQQSIWIDHLSRSWLAVGSLEAWIRRGCRGVTSNPTIFEKSLASETSYDADLAELLGSQVSTEEAYWELVSQDVALAASQLLPVYEASSGSDGYVSVEVAPALAHDLEATIAAAVNLRSRLAADNILIKIPATQAGVAAIGPLIARGINLNLTLIFSLERYREVAEAYIGALEQLDDQQIPRVAGVASFFVSRVDTEVDARLMELARNPAGLALPQPGQAAVAQAKLAYEIFSQLFSGVRWQKLAAKGARVQRPLWASTSTKNPAYPDTLYVDSLIGPDTVNTLPEVTARAFDDHGLLEPTIAAKLDQAHQLWQQLADCGIDLDDVAMQLEQQGLKSFSQSFDQALVALAAKAESLQARP